MLVCFWSPKGGSGTSVVAAAAAVFCSRSSPACLADLAGDQAAVLGVGNDPAPGLHDWLRAGAGAPADALMRLAVDAGERLSLLPCGEPGLDGVPPEAGAALAVALREEPSYATTLCDAGRLDHPALEACNDVADASVVVLRGCYLALRRAIHHPSIAYASGVVLVEEHARSLGARDVEDVLDIPVLAVVEARAPVAHAVDAGLLSTRVPESLMRPLGHALSQLGCPGAERAA